MQCKALPMPATFEYSSRHMRSKGRGHRTIICRIILFKIYRRKYNCAGRPPNIRLSARYFSVVVVDERSRKRTVAKGHVEASQANERTHATNRSRRKWWIMPRAKREEQCRYTSSLRLTSMGSEPSSFVCSLSKSAISSGCASQGGTTAT